MTPTSKRPRHSSNVAKLHVDCLFALFQFLEPYEIAQLRNICTVWNGFITGPQTEGLWKKRFQREYGEAILELHQVEKLIPTRGWRSKPKLCKVLEPRKKPLQKVTSWYEEYMQVYRMVPFLNTSDTPFQKDLQNRRREKARQVGKEEALRFKSPDEEYDEPDFHRWDAIEDALTLTVFERKPEMDFRALLLSAFLAALCEDGYIPSRTELVKVGYYDPEDILLGSVGKPLMTNDHDEPAESHADEPRKRSFKLVPLSQFSYYVLMNYAEHLYPLRSNDQSFTAETKVQDFFQQHTEPMSFSDYTESILELTDTEDENKVAVSLNTEGALIPFVWYMDSSVYDSYGDPKLDSERNISNCMKQIFDIPEVHKINEFLCSSEEGKSWVKKYHNANFSWYGFHSIVLGFEMETPTKDTRQRDTIYALKTEQAIYANL